MRKMTLLQAEHRIGMALNALGIDVTRRTTGAPEIRNPVALETDHGVVILRPGSDPYSGTIELQPKGQFHRRAQERIDVDKAVAHLAGRTDNGA